MNKGKYKSVKQFIEEQKMERIKTQHEWLAKTIKDIATKIDSTLVANELKIDELNEIK